MSSISYQTVIVTLDDSAAAENVLAGYAFVLQLVSDYTN
jgi:hypothetical protein